MDRRNFLKFSGIIAAASAVTSTAAIYTPPRTRVLTLRAIWMVSFAGQVEVDWTHVAHIKMVDDRSVMLKFLQSFNADHSVDRVKLIGLEGGVLVDGELRYPYGKTDFQFQPIRVGPDKSIEFSFTKPVGKLMI